MHFFPKDGGTSGLTSLLYISIMANSEIKIAYIMKSSFALLTLSLSFEKSCTWIRFNYTGIFTQTQILQWLGHGSTVRLECKPRLVNMDLSGHYSLELPRSLFTCTSIEVMALSLHGSMEKTTIKPRSVFLPCLGSLTLSCVALGNDIMEKLATGCHVLEEMVMNRCGLDMAEISFPYLRSLIIENCHVETEVCISIPNLVSLQIEKVESGMIWLRNMSSLLKASLSLYCILLESEHKKSK